jgi:nucleotide-binding universal stress UspA family protein
VEAASQKGVAIVAEQERLPIVVGVDGLETGRRALDWALREAQVRDCPVQVVHAWTFDPMADYFTETSSQQVHQESLAMLRREVEQATERSRLTSGVNEGT